MKKKLLVLPALLLSLSLIASCKNTSTSGTSSAQTTVKAETDAFTDGDLEEVSVSDASATITLNGNSASTTATSGELSIGACNFKPRNEPAKTKLAWKYLAAAISITARTTTKKAL